jgi:1,4-dihydroxy-2-naphthoate octaprenyltransferase
MLLSPWFRAARLQLHTIGITPLLLGSVAAFYETGEFGWMRFIVAEIIGLMIHLVTAFGNDVVDIETDEQNTSRSAFSGGSGVIVEGKLTRAQLRNAATAAAICAVLLTGVLVFFFGVHWAIFLFMGWGLLSGAGYSLPPLRISYRGGGEFLVMLTYSLPLVWAGYIVQTGPVPSILPWMLSAPIAFAVFSLITITQFPDQVADRIAKKRSLVILLGEQRTLNLVATGIILSMLGVVALFFVKSLPAWAGGLSLLCLPFALDSLWTIFRHETGEAAWIRLCRDTIMLTLGLGLAPTCGMLLGHWLA